VDYWGIVQQAFRVTRTRRALWGFGGVAAVSGLLSTVVLGSIGLMAGLVVALTQLVVAGDVSAIASLQEGITTLSSQIQGVAQPWVPAIVAGVLVIGIFWLAVIVVDVAATGGAVMQTDAALEGRDVSFQDGMRQGFEAWGRTATVLAVAVAPALSVALLQAAALFTTVTLPLMAGTPPDATRVFVANQMASSIGSLVSVLAIPLGVLAMLALRWTLIEGVSWHKAFAMAWRACRTHFVEVLLMYLVLLAISLAAGLLIGIVVTVIVSLAVAIPAGYALARLRLPFRGAILLLFAYQMLTRVSEKRA